MSDRKSDTDNDDYHKKLLISIAIKIFIVIGIGTAIAFWYMSTL